MPLIANGVNVKAIIANGVTLDTVISNGVVVWEREHPFVTTVGSVTTSTVIFKGYDSQGSGGDTGSISPTQYLGLDVDRMLFIFYPVGSPSPSANITHFEFSLLGSHVGTDPFTSIEVEGLGTLNRTSSETPAGAISIGSTFWRWILGAGDHTPSEWDTTGKTPIARVIE